jgi:hypothetical protein
LYFDFQKTLTIGYFLIAENDSDFKSINKARQSFFTNMLSKSIQPYQDDFIKELGSSFDKSKGIGIIVYAEIFPANDIFRALILLFSFSN